MRLLGDERVLGDERTLARGAKKHQFWPRAHKPISYVVLPGNHGGVEGAEF
eukprot:SAG11_NODE_820_length_7014_cov_7.427187_1_plen_51_part_00